MAYKDKRNNSWRAQWQIDGQRKSKGGFSSKRNAEAYERQQKIQYERILIGHPEQPNVPFDDIFKKYLAWAYENKRPKSAKRDESCIGIWKKFFKDKKLLLVSQIRKHTQGDFVEWRSAQRTCRGEYPSKRTMYLDLETLRKTLEWATREGIIQENPIKELNLRNQKKSDVPHFFSEEEIEIIEENCENQELKSAVEVLVRTGMRSGELCSLKRDNLDFERSQILLRPDQTKSKYPRAIPLGNTVKQKLEELAKEVKNDDDFLFCTRTGKKQTPDNLNNRLRTLLNALEKEGLMKNTKKGHIHTFRRTYISHMIMKGVDPVKVMAIVGHKEWSTIKRYLALSPKYIAEGTDVLPF